MKNTPRQALELLIEEIAGYSDAALEHGIYSVVGAADALQRTGAIDMNEELYWGDRARIAGMRRGWRALDRVLEEFLLKRIKDYERIQPPPPPEDPAPKPGESTITTLPDGADGIRYTVGRMIRMIQDARKDALVISLARKIAAVSSSEQDGAGRELYWLRGIHAWCRANFTFVHDPVGIELIQTPNRMLRELQIPAELHLAVWAPIGKAMGGNLPPPKMTGDADEATVISMALAASIGIEPLRVVLGGTDNMIHTCWGQAYVDGKWVDIDVLEEWGPKNGRCKAFEHMDVPL